METVKDNPKIYSFYYLLYDSGGAVNKNRGWGGTAVPVKDENNRLNTSFAKFHDLSFKFCIILPIRNSFQFPFSFSST